jgi:hypothetical protein
VPAAVGACDVLWAGLRSRSSATRTIEAMKCAAGACSQPPGPRGNYCTDHGPGKGRIVATASRSDGCLQLWEFDHRLKSGESRDGDYSWCVMLVDDEDDFVSEVDAASLQLAMDAARDTYRVEAPEWHWMKRTGGCLG